MNSVIILEGKKKKWKTKANQNKKKLKKTADKLSTNKIFTQNYFKYKKI